MTKGKYATRATLRREDNSVRSEIESYQHAVKRLTAENRELGEQLAARQSAHAQEMRRLKALLDEGLSPELAALREELGHQREKADTATREMREIWKKWDRAFKVMTAWFHEAYGCTGLEAAEAILAVLGSHPDATLKDVGGGEHLPDDAKYDRIRQIQAVRGFRAAPRIGLGVRPAPRESASDRKKDRWRDPV